MELTDLEVCKRIVEIEGVQHQIECEDMPNAYMYSEELNMEYNPLTDDGLCFQLMVKHKVDVQHYTDKRRVECTIWEHHGNFFVDEISRASDKKPNKAICLAIIEAHNER